MTSAEPVHIPQAAFAGGRFWRWLNHLADDRGHAGHTRWLIGETERLNRYRLRCSTCDVVVVEMIIDFETAG